MLLGCREPDRTLQDEVQPRVQRRAHDPVRSQGQKYLNRIFFFFLSPFFFLFPSLPSLLSSTLEKLPNLFSKQIEKLPSEAEYFFGAFPSEILSFFNVIPFDYAF